MPSNIGNLAQKVTIDARPKLASEVDFSLIRYAQCWEDADILLEALDIQPGDNCLAIASSGDNALAMLSKSPERVVALDLSHAQLACLELRVAAYSALTHTELLELMGSIPSNRRNELYQKCRKQLTPLVKNYWDSQSTAIESGIGSIGKFEQYFSMFRDSILPLVHSRSRVEKLLQNRTPKDRRTFYQKEWNTLRWRLMFQFFFSRFVMGRLGRDTRFFRYVEGSVAARILQRAQYALTELDPMQNPYLQWILQGRHSHALPYALRHENFDAIRNNLHRIEWHCLSVEEYLQHVGQNAFDKYNLSDIFEYMSEDQYENLLKVLVQAGRKKGRLAYWNMLVPRSRPASMEESLRPLTSLSQELFKQDKAFFYSAFVLEEII
ncbi:S-adenosylmethionine:diacylglycerol 3-amino-3-carboxypropyl transferase-like protein [Brevibacillus laterosporus GI-9]|uniref:DUF3419 family protein n=1 Tax=Brevibacillus laterosporus TaxID=1465 RepID=UPI00024047CD|nr:DUF3419 family protein [Brevibacillus laterosporus]CCF12699.1 S-adenosylmethionine:diacylglycerol 3-amino-3-carboxypropyl transferase-like protein [Brevibacillus laterosporus GI-9]